MSVSRRYLRSISIFCILAAFLTSVARPQTTSGTIVGTVTDQSGAVVPNAKITLTDEATKDTRETTTKESGEFVFAALRPSTYTIAVETAGFQTFRQTGIVLAQQRPPQPRQSSVDGGAVDRVGDHYRPGPGH